MIKKINWITLALAISLRFFVADISLFPAFTWGSKLSLKQEHVDSGKWLIKFSVYLKEWIPREKERASFLRAVQREAKRVGIDPRLVVAIIHVESKFDKYAVSPIGAQGYMQVMPFWRDLIGKKDDNLFDTNTSIRYGCQILRYYLDQEKGSIVKALQRYNGNMLSLYYPYRVWKSWSEFLH